MIRIPVSRYVSASVLALTLAMPAALSPMLASPAHAFGFGRIVYDPTNYAQNLLTAARTLEQINHQITSLQNEAQMLINQAKNLASLPYSSLQTLQQNVSRTQQLLAQAQNIAFDVQNVDQMFQQKYGKVSLSATDAQLVADARSRWQNTVGGLQDAMRVQAGVVGNIDTRRAVPLQPIPLPPPSIPCASCWMGCATSLPLGSSPAPSGRKTSFLMQKRMSLTKSAASCAGRKKSFTMKCVLS